MGDDTILKRLRALCLRFPEVRETKTFGNPTFQAGKKTFAVLDIYKGQRCICFKVPRTLQESLCEQAAFFVAPYGGKHGWTCVRVSGRLPWKRLELLIEESYRLNALKRMLEAFDAQE